MTRRLPEATVWRRGLALIAVAALIVVLAACSTPEAEEAAMGGITIEDPWVRPAGAESARHQAAECLTFEARFRYTRSVRSRGPMRNGSDAHDALEHRAADSPT
jgi:hypothetical protein